jgi:three-Cys-motif partner protein
VGSPLLGLRAIPPYHRCVFMDSGRQEAEALRARTAFARDRVTVARGDVNSDLLPLMDRVLDRRAPCLCLLDPEGTELMWTTIKELAGFRHGPRKVELLILLPTHTGFIRMLSLEADLPEWAAKRMTDMYGDDRWRAIWRQRRADQIESREATTEYVRLYARRLRELHYRHVLDREIRSASRHGQLLYFLIFATDHEAGERIMDHCFDTAYHDPQLTLFRTERAKRLP